MKANALPSRKGVKRSKETREKISKSKREICWGHHSEETKQRMSNSFKGKINTKKYIIISPDGKEYLTENGLTMFCEDRGLHASNFYKVISGEYRQCNGGWKIKKGEMI